MKNRYESIVDEQTEMICRISPKRKVTYRNPAFIRFFDFKESGNNKAADFCSLFPTEGTRTCETHFRELRMNSPRQEFEVRNLDKRGDTVWQYWSIHAFHSHSGILLGYQAVGTDITKRKNAELALAASEERWQTVFENADDLIMTLNGKGVILSINDYRGLPEDADWTGRRVSDVMLTENAAKVMDMLNAVFEKGTTVKKELKISDASDALDVYSCAICPVRHGDKVVTATLIARNITEDKNLEKRTREALVEGQENERIRVSQELHDGLGQMITAVKLNIQQMRSGSDVEDTGLEELERNVETAIREVKNISRNLMPDVLSQFGLVPALEDLVEKCDARSEINISLQTVDTDQRYAPELEMTLFRICQELLNNAIRHSRASNAFVQLIDHANSIVLMAEDDGVGFDTEKETTGFGLRNIRSRADLLGGRAETDSTIDRGTVTTVEIPLLHS